MRRPGSPAWRVAPLLVLLAGFAAPARVAAVATFVVDAQGEGFEDPTPVAEVAGNPGLTLGDQRLAAVLHAADRWGELLDSKVPVVVEVRFVDLGCDEGGAVLAHAGAAKLVRGMAGGDPNVWYPSALANRLAGTDLNPGEPDVLMALNSAVDGACREVVGGWYYGFDGARGKATDLVETVLHELAHGLGFSSSIDAETGEASLPTGTDAFSAHVVDLRTGKRWASLTAAERRLSAQLGRGLAFDGPRTQRAAAGVLSAGADPQGRPLLYTRTPADRGSAVSHFDPRVRPDLLMEPFARSVPTHEVDLTLAVLADLGWTSGCGNGRVDPGEECDEGGRNGNQPGASCRLGCRRARCGDGVVDPGEQCDLGVANGATGTSPCSAECRAVACEDDAACDDAGTDAWDGDDGDSVRSAQAGAPLAVRGQAGCGLPDGRPGASAPALVLLVLAFRRAGRAGRRG